MRRKLELISAADIIDEGGGIEKWTENVRAYQKQRREMIARLVAKPRRPPQPGNFWRYDKKYDCIQPDHPKWNYYWISLDRCDTPEKREHWLWHLSEKYWCTEPVLVDFLDWANSKE